MQTAVPTLLPGAVCGCPAVRTRSVTSYGYDSMQRLTSVSEKNGTTQNAAWSYTYDKDGNRLTQAMSGNTGAPGTGIRRFTYNAADELATVDGSSANIGYDANGDETASPAFLAGSVDGRSTKVASIGDVVNMTSNTNGNSFDYSNAQVLPTGTRNLTWAHDISYTWNPAGPESYTAPDGSGQVSVFTLPNGQTLGYQYQGKMTYLHKDRLGSVLAMSEDPGNKSAWYRYDPYGQPRGYNRNTTTAGANTLMYVGMPRDWTTGLIRMGARWYDPSLGRFTTADPSGQELNPYLYAAGNPVNGIDLEGLSWTSTLLGTGIGTFAGSFFKGACGVSVVCEVGGFVATTLITGLVTGAATNSIDEGLEASAGAALGYVAGPVGERVGRAWMRSHD